VCESYSYTGWRRLIGSPKLQIIFHKTTTTYRSLLQNMTYKDKGSYKSSPPCTHLAKNYRCLLQNKISFIGLFYNRDLKKHMCTLPHSLIGSICPFFSCPPMCMHHFVYIYIQDNRAPQSIFVTFHPEGALVQKARFEIPRCMCIENKNLIS